jgi:hypothetical protein
VGVESKMAHGLAQILSMALVIGAGGAEGLPKARPVKRKVVERVHMPKIEQVLALARAASSKGYAAIVVFECEEVRPEKGKPVGLEVQPDELLKTAGAWRIKGNFRTVKVFGGASPRCGAVNELQYLSKKWGGDHNYRRLRPIIDRAVKGKKYYYAALGTGKGTGILESTFLGPFPEKAIQPLCACLKQASEHPSDKLTEDSCHKLIKAGNPFSVCVGLARLRALKKLTVRAFFESMDVVESGYVPALARELLMSVARGENRPVELRREMLRFLRRATAERQAVLLDFILDVVKTSSWHTQRLLAQPDFIDGLRKISRKRHETDKPLGQRYDALREILAQAKRKVDRSSGGRHKATVGKD